MNLKLFNVATTNLFPATNTTTGGQLITEYNMRCRESVEGPENIEYMQGLSFVHSEKDFALYIPAGAGGYFPDVTSGGTIICINSGRAVVNGYYVENTVPMEVDMLAVNQAAVAAGDDALSGKLGIGLRVMFSTEQNVNGSILVEDSENRFFEGVQVIILPADELLTPTSKVVSGSTVYDCGLPENKWRVTADIILGTFTFINGSISNLKNNYPQKCQMIPASRVTDIDGVISDRYVTKNGLNPKKLYTFAGKGVDPETGHDTWCDSTDALMVWDNSPQLTSEEPAEQEASFQIKNNFEVRLAVPHKQVDGMVDGSDQPQYYATKYVNVPMADFANGAPGMVNLSYTNSVKSVTKQINELYHLAGGKQRGFVDELDKIEDLPYLDTAWEAGDYVLVAKDRTVLNTLNDTLQLTPPSTLYVVLPGIVTEINSSTSGTRPSGTRLDIAYHDLLEEMPAGAPIDIQIPSKYMGWWDLMSGKYRGVVDEDYFELVVTNGAGITTRHYYTVKTTDGIKTYSAPIQLTGQYPFATESLTGGFLNVPSSYVDGGYVYLDDYGHLRLMDYALLRSGTLAYQLGADYTVEAGLTLDEVQALIDEYVNERVAFPTLQQAVSSDPNVITVTINLPADSAEEQGTLNISGLDSRFNTAVHIKIYGSATSYTTVNISDCEKVRVSLVEGTPKINLYRSSLYYDAYTLSVLNTITDLSLWYEKYEDTDPNLLVDGMTVRVVADPSAYANSQVNYNVVSSEYWTTSSPNDNHFMVATQSVSFGSDGTITGFGVLVRNDSTSNVVEGRQIVREEFEMPQGPELNYPVNRLLQPVKITGRFVSAYPVQSPEGYMIQETDFSLSTSYMINSTVAGGTIAFLVNSYVLETTPNTTIDVWDTTAFHHFEGTTLL